MGTDMEVWLEPHPILATRRRMEEQACCELVNEFG
jgi:hypothetical protein